MTNPTKIYSADELSTYVARVDALNGPERNAVFATYEYCLDLDLLRPLDPFSKAYSEKIYDQFRGIRATDYVSAEESNIFPFHLDDPYPYSSRSPSVVGTHFGAIYTILRDFPISPPGRVLDVGSGWGHTSLALARTGFDVDPLDINQTYLDLISEWARRLGVSHRVSPLCLQFTEFDRIDKKYDAILFFESFHHSIEHQTLLENCEKLLNDDGALVFAGEPIFTDWPVPWSVRSDSVAVYCIHKLGWMELGLNEEYFLELLARTGFYAERRTYPDYVDANGFVARKERGSIPIPHLALPKRIEDTWHSTDANFRWTKGAALLPTYILRGRTKFAIHLQNFRPSEIDVTVLVDGVARRKITLRAAESAVLDVDCEQHSKLIEIKSDQWCPADLGPSPDVRRLGVAVSTISFPPER